MGETVAVTLDGDEQPATIGSGGAFSSTFDATALTVADSPDTITYAYTSDGTFASASTTSTLTVNPATLTITARLRDQGLRHRRPSDRLYRQRLAVERHRRVSPDRRWRAGGRLAGEQAGGYVASFPGSADYAAASRTPPPS